jgi:hypothetical protein
VARRGLSPLTSRPDGLVDFTTGERDVIVDVLRGLVDAGAGWVNIRPLVDEDDLPPPPGLAAVFSAKGPPLPIGTWVFSRHRDGTPAASSIGIAHPAGTKVATRIVDAGLRPPPTWRGRQDNPRRGLVVEVPPDGDVAEGLDWLLRVLLELSPIALAGEWRAEVFRR